MSFWDVFTQESLQKPWVIRPEGSDTDLPLVEPDTARVFIAEPGLSEPQLSMMTKMVVALKLSTKDVSIVCLDQETALQVESWSNPKKILFFGKSYPGDFGSSLHYFGHQVIKTHSVVELEANPALKRETWAHLQLFGSLK